MRKIKVSTASEHDTLHFKEVLDPANTNCNIFANKGYVNGEREERLGKQGWRMQIQRKGSQNKPISGAQERCNKRIAKTRVCRTAARTSAATAEPYAGRGTCAPRTPYRPFPGSRRRRKAIARSGAAPAVGATGTTEMAQNEKSPLGSGLFLYCEFLEARTGIEPV